MSRLLFLFVGAKYKKLHSGALAGTGINTDFFAADLPVTRDGILHLAYSTDADEVLSITVDGTNYEIIDAATGVATVSLLDIPVAQGNTVNFQTASDANFDIFQVILETG